MGLGKWTFALRVGVAALALAFTSAAFAQETSPPEGARPFILTLPNSKLPPLPDRATGALLRRPFGVDPAELAFAAELARKREAERLWLRNFERQREAEQARRFQSMSDGAEQRRDRRRR
jgi:hypothetical protein